MSRLPENEPLGPVESLRHDLNNLIMALLGHIDMLREMKELPERARDRIDTIRHHAQQIRDRVATFGPPPAIDPPEKENRRGG